MPKNPALDRISLAIKAKKRQTKLGVRAAAAECGISPATFSRLERGISSSLPDAETLTKLATWLETNVSQLIQPEAASTKPATLKNTTPEIVEVHLRADKNLSPETAKALAEMFKSLYNQVAKKRAD